MNKKDRLLQEITKMRENWKQIQDDMEEMYLYWQGEGATSHRRLYETGIKQPLLCWMEEMEDEAENFFGED